MLLTSIIGHLNGTQNTLWPLYANITLFVGREDAAMLRLGKFIEWQHAKVWHHPTKGRQSYTIKFGVFLFGAKGQGQEANHDRCYYSTQANRWCIGIMEEDLNTVMEGCGDAIGIAVEITRERNNPKTSKTLPGRKPNQQRLKVNMKFVYTAENQQPEMLLELEEHYPPRTSGASIITEQCIRDEAAKLQRK